MILAADLGSTNLKTAVFTADGKRLGCGSRPTPYKVHTNVRCELSPEAVARAFDEAVLEAIQSADISPEQIECASFTSQAQTFCVTDSEGRAQGSMIGWADARGEAEAAFLNRTLAPSIHKITGWPGISSGHLAAKALWWKTEYGLAPGQHFATLPSYLAMRLGAPLVLDRNLAAMTGLFHVLENRWWVSALDAAGIQAGHLGGVVEIGAKISVTQPPGSRMLPGLKFVVFAGNDHTAGAFGCGCSKSRFVLTLGTAGVCYRFAGHTPGPFSEAGLWGPFPGGGFYEARFISHACSALDWADEYLFGSVDSQRFVEVARTSAPDCGGVVFDPERWGTSEAWSGSGTPAEMALAVLVGIANSLHELAVPMLRAADTNFPPEIVVLGGGSRLDFWVQMLANQFQCDLMRWPTDALTGAARMAGSAVEECPDPTVTRSSPCRLPPDSPATIFRG